MSDGSAGPGSWPAPDGKWHQPVTHASHGTPTLPRVTPTLPQPASAPQPVRSYHDLVPSTPPRKRARRGRKLLLALGAVVGVVVVASIAASPQDDADQSGERSTPVSGGEVAPADAPLPAPVEPASNLTPSQQNAVRSAQSYLDFSGFSRQGLIDQLSSEYGEQYPLDDAIVAVDSLAVDWNAEAVESARSYLDFTAFSRQGLIDQLSSEYGEQFTLEQATFAVDSLAVDWNAEAAESARSYLDMTGFSCQGLIDQLSSAYGEQFTVEQATYGASQAGIC